MESAWLKRLIYNSYKYIWVYTASAFLSPFFVQILSHFHPILGFAGYLFGFISAELLERGLGPRFKRNLISAIEKRKLMDKRFYLYFEGWASFLASMVIALILSIFMRPESFSFGIFAILIPMAVVLFVTTLLYGIIKEKI
jgi:hypothetical protein